MKRVAKRVGLALLAAFGLLVVYGLFVEPRLILDEERVQVSLPGLPAEGATVAVFGDLQIGMWFANEGMVEQVVATVVEERPDAALLTGDFVLSRDPDPATQIDRVVELLAPLLDSGIHTFAVLGNHDHEVRAADQVASALSARGVQVLRNEAALVPGAGGLHVVGIGALRAGLADVDAALAQVPDGAPRVVLMHNPAVFPTLPANSAPLAVAGHTHCGQIVIPGLPAWSYLELTAAERVVTDGFADVPTYGAAGNRLYVNCGVGFSLVPMRIGAPPEVTFVELSAA
ncbi:MAG: metallophosphoesterase [Pseudonocardia sp.]|nr:metallophosphoesterase [Pseudonocardia sp.]